MKFGVVVYPGSNCDADCYHVIKDVVEQPVEYIWHQNTSVKGFDCLILPGGFSYGDYLRAGAIARFSPVGQAVAEFAAAGGLVLGICNGFQILLEAGLLPGAMKRNQGLKFRCHQSLLRVEQNANPFTNQLTAGKVIQVPVAHGQGNYYCDEATYQELEANKQIVFRYSNASGELTPEANPNGSLESIAGICNKQGNVLGMMPHPERCADSILGGTDGLAIFRSIINWWERGEQLG
ncbi:MAG: phosphoribosylformylglycinamidine synthase subunit PurQ [Bacillota bacterium]|nr:phosphoribosylformylglycinamidine synthase subunit PurQ [Bacillota bacterium]